jgi:hypothetical protein
VRSRAGRPLPRILAGQDEPIFDVLPGNVLENLHRPASENAVVWNRIYPLVLNGLDLDSLMRVTPLWGVGGATPFRGELEAFFWGYSIKGKPAPGLDRALGLVDGRGPRTEIDLILAGPEDLVLVEAKHTAHLGRCGRYGKGRCPEIQQPTDEDACRYWAVDEARFDRVRDWRHSRIRHRALRYLRRPA